MSDSTPSTNNGHRKAKVLPFPGRRRAPRQRGPGPTRPAGVEAAGAFARAIELTDALEGIVSLMDRLPLVNGEGQEHVHEPLRSCVTVDPEDVRRFGLAVRGLTDALRNVLWLLAEAFREQGIDLLDFGLAAEGAAPEPVEG